MSARRPSTPPIAPLSYTDLAPVLRGMLGEGDRRYVLHLRTSEEIQDFLGDARVESLSQIGCATPDHVIRTKRFPLWLHVRQGHGDVGLRELIADRLERYRSEYGNYVRRQMAQKGIVVKPLDPDPRVILVRGLGLVGAGKTPEAARIAADLYEHTIQVIRNAEAVGQYQALPEGDIFDMEYWSLEQAKLGRSAPKALEGRVVYVTGAARGIGAAVARRFAQEGAVLYLVDRDAEALATIARELKCGHEVLDLGEERAVRRSIERAVQLHGGIDGVVSNAGVASQGAVEGLRTETLEDSFKINFYAHHWVASAAADVMKRQRMGGFVLFNASKAAFNPGPGFGPYAIAKAALVALVKQYALELGAYGIRFNAVNADRVRTGLLDADDVAARAKARGIDTDDYYRSNLLQREVTVADVAHAFVCLALAESTTGSVLTVDGGNLAASPR